MAWFYLLVAGLFEFAWAVGVRYTDGFTRLWPSLGTAVAMALSLYFLSLSMRVLPIGTAYAVWTGVGAAAVAVFGMVALGEPRTLARVACIGLILCGVIGLKFFANPEG